MPTAPDGTPLPYPGEPGGPSPIEALLGGGQTDDHEADIGEDDASAPDIETVLADARELLQSEGLSEANRLLLEQATTLLQRIRANMSKDEQTAAQNPQMMMARAYGQ